MSNNPASERRSYTVPAGTLSAVHFGPLDTPVKLVFLHANGFNGYAYKSLFEPLGVHSIAIDLRGQGMSTDFTLTPNSLKNFHPFADDVSAFLRDYIDQPAVIVGHSLGGVVGLLAAQNVPEKVSGYLGFDPVTVPGFIRAMPHIPGGSWFLRNGFDWAKKAGKRRNQFDNLDAAFEHYNGRGTFKFLPDAVVRDYLTGGMIENSNGVSLSCDPLWEQAVYGAQAQNVFKAAKALPPGSKIIFAGKKPASTPLTRAKMGRVLGHDNVIYHEDYSHFFPLIQQDVTRNYLLAAIAAANGG